jgi:methylthioribose-1-phosphate isomerase
MPRQHKICPSYGWMTRVRARTSEDLRDEETRIARGARRVSMVTRINKTGAVSTQRWSPIFGAAAATALAMAVAAWEGRRLVRQRMTQATWVDVTANLLWATRRTAINLEPPQTRRQYINLVDHVRGSVAGCCF